MLNNLNKILYQSPFNKQIEMNNYFNDFNLQKFNYPEERFIYPEELEKIINIMTTNDQYRILILGAIGTGKSTLLRMVSQKIGQKTPDKILSGIDLYNNDFHSLEEAEMPIFIDGIDEFVNPNKLLNYICAKKYQRIICTSRYNVQHNNFFTHVLNLNSLTRKQVLDLIYRLNLEDNLRNLLINNTNAGNSLTPKNILQQVIELASKTNIEEFYCKQNNLLYQYGRGIEFSSSPILYKNELITPPKELINGVTIVNDTLLRKVKNDPNIMRGFSPHEFERMVCELLDKEGYNVKLTKQTRDGGKDIIVVQKSILGEFCIYVECKKYDKTHPVSVKFVRELYGTVMADDATAGMIMTTSYFTKDAKEYTKKIKHRMALKDYNDLIQEINKIKII
ncbi:MAG: restriction endonuclease [Ruminococcus sp.]|nr:restriction endonuclease [Ruminococcus sp.]